MVFGTLDGELVVINHESEKLVGYLPSVGALNSILGLCWLKKHPSKIFKDLHKEHINVVKFAHHSPTVFATASFDKDVKMWDLRQGTSQPCFPYRPIPLGTGANTSHLQGRGSKSSMFIQSLRGDPFRVSIYHMHSFDICDF
ncbi:hypothetical protein BHE74_00032050 [Ensete ventricosum]|nr:hypothetical protein BHE74_00032050 [Ensete ventricosum]